MYIHPSLVVIILASLALGSQPAGQDAINSDANVHPIVAFLWQMQRQEDPCTCDFTPIAVTFDGEWFDFPCESCASPETFTYDFYSMEGYVGSSIDARSYVDLNDITRYAMTIDFQPDTNIYGDVTNVFGIRAEWNPLPRTPVYIEPDQDWLRDAVRRALEIAKPEVEDALAGFIQAGFDGYLGDEFNYHDISTDPIRIKEAVSIDLDGDGDQEYVVTAFVGDLYRYDHTGVLFPVLINDSDVFPLATMDLEVLIKTNMDEQWPNIEFYLDSNGDGLLEIVIEYGCCLASICEFISLKPDGQLERHAFNTNRWP